MALTHALRPWILRTVLALMLPLVVSGAPVDFGRDVQPLLADRCFACHGPDEAQRQAGLRLDMRSTAVVPAVSGRVPLAPGDPDASEVLRRVSAADPATRMPPAYMGHDPLEASEIDTLRRWIEGGAGYEVHWAFNPPQRSPLPKVSNPGWQRQDLDSFVLARLDAEGWSPSTEATPAQWLRRMMLDLNGLPPTPEDIRLFKRAVRLHGDFAYEDAVDRTLASQRYGERMAMDWLDVARYADTHGFNNDSERSMWRWRDWVIAAFNTNLPYDRFIVEQLAGDLLAEPTLDQLIATGFNRNHVINSEGGIIGEEYRVEYVADRVRTLGMAWLGLTFECARCHDHKFDPISQEDYYRLFAFFDNVPEIGEAGRVANAVPMIPAPTAEQQRRIADLGARIEALEGGTRLRADLWEPVADSIAAVEAPEFPANADFFLGCEDGDRNGIAGQACGSREVEPDEEFKLEKHGAFTLSLWMRAEDEQLDAPLFSAADYSPDPTSTSHGAGIELRLVGDEVELRLSKRFPSYSMTLRSEGAELLPEQWHHVTVVYEGSEGKDSMRQKAAWVRLFVDGREYATQVLHDDAHTAAQFKTPFRLAHDNSPDGHQFAGRLDEVAVWKRALGDDEVEQAFESVALPWASTRTAWERERLWLYRELHPDEELDSLRRKLFALKRGLPTTMVMQEMATRRQTHLLIRGRYDSPGKPVVPGVPENLLGSWPEGAPNDRRGLASWLTSPIHPTTARVVVNRFWQQLFGTGLVKTSGDFGLQGEAPSHPELLDWLAVDLVESGWNVKRLMKLIVLSATYRQDSATTPHLRALDPRESLARPGAQIPVTGGDHSRPGSFPSRPPERACRWPQRASVPAGRAL